MLGHKTGCLPRLQTIQGLPLSKPSSEPERCCDETVQYLSTKVLSDQIYTQFYCTISNAPSACLAMMSCRDYRFYEIATKMSTAVHGNQYNDDVGQIYEQKWKNIFRSSMVFMQQLEFRSTERGHTEVIIQYEYWI
jgi:hypothetical protein